MVVTLIALVLSPLYQAQPVQWEADTKSPKAVVAAMYDVISGPAGEKRSWDRLQNLFGPEGRLMVVFKRRDGSATHRAVTVKEYYDASAPLMENSGFYEKGTETKISQHDLIAHADSKYESRYKLTDSKPFEAGVNLFEMYSDGKRWYISSIIWQGQ